MPLRGIHSVDSSGKGPYLPRWQQTEYQTREANQVGKPERSGAMAGTLEMIEVADGGLRERIVSPISRQNDWRIQNSCLHVWEYSI